ncbi:coiled-coil domain-containing protein 6 [Strigomonas culicis]|uniref:Coiled-coil domain-containing protein 6 n=1 Tax=Strigomonas culicis TaxID=28005 RepID=S9V4B0_9TRYP|nr:coiled-coil domain-containing protein 6 [Strigomonas culicis]|eukprot:EPY17695.1 coiled-coil domain-containing protein 6 [Strigomonas culicis]
MSICTLSGAELSLDKLSTEELRAEYVQLKAAQFNVSHKKANVELKCELLREESVRLQQLAEVEEEHTANQWLRRLGGAEKEVRLMRQALKDEELAGNSLSLQIRDVEQRRTEVEDQLEEREEYLLLTIQRQFFAVVEKKVALERRVMEERERYLTLLSKQLAKVREMLPAESSVSVMGSSIGGSSPGDRCRRTPPAPTSPSCASRSS